MSCREPHRLDRSHQPATNPRGLWQLIRKFSGFYNIPLIAIVLAALFLPRAASRRLWAWFYSTSPSIPSSPFSGILVSTLSIGTAFCLCWNSAHWRYSQARTPKPHQPSTHRWISALALSLVGRGVPMALHHCLVCAAVTDRHFRLVIAERSITLSQYIFAPCP